MIARLRIDVGNISAIIVGAIVAYDASPIPTTPRNNRNNQNR